MSCEHSQELSKSTNAWVLIWSPYFPSWHFSCCSKGSGIIAVLHVWIGFSCRCPGGGVGVRLMLRCSNLTSCCSLSLCVCVLAVAEVSRRRCCSLDSLPRSGNKSGRRIIQLGNVSSSANGEGKETKGAMKSRRSQWKLVTAHLGTLMYGCKQEKRRFADHAVITNGNFSLEFPLGKG